jgi:hypothetical protein
MIMRKLMAFLCAVMVSAGTTFADGDTPVQNLVLVGNANGGMNRFTNLQEVAAMTGNFVNLTLGGTTVTNWADIAVTGVPFLASNNVFSAGTTQAFAFATITNNATTGTQIVNYQTMTGMNYADKDLYNEFATSNKFNGNIYLAHNVALRSLGDGAIVDSTGDLVMDWGNTFRTLYNTNSQQILGVSGTARPTLYSAASGVWLSDGTATNGTEIVNYQTMTGMNYADKDLYNVFTISNRFNGLIYVKTGGTIGAEGMSDEIFGIRDSSGTLAVLYGPVTRQIMSTNGAVVMSYAGVPVLMNDAGKIWQSEGAATQGQQIVNYQTMTNYADRVLTNSTVMQFTAASMVQASGTNLAWNSYNIINGRVYVASTNGLAGSSFSQPCQFSIRSDGTLNRDGVYYRWIDVPMYSTYMTNSALAGTNIIYVQDASGIPNNSLLYLMDGTPEFVGVTNVSGSTIYLENSVVGAHSSGCGVSLVKEFSTPGYDATSANKVWYTLRFGSAQTASNITVSIKYKK